MNAVEEHDGRFDSPDGALLCDLENSPAPVMTRRNGDPGPEMTVMTLSIPRYLITGSFRSHFASKEETRGGGDYTANSEEKPLCSLNAICSIFNFSFP